VHDTQLDTMGHFCLLLSKFNTKFRVETKVNPRMKVTHYFGLNLWF